MAFWAIAHGDPPAADLPPCAPAAPDARPWAPPRWRLRPSSRSPHLPNPILTAASFVWGLAACLLFLRYRNLYILAITHAILGITLAMTVPGPVIRNMRVGLGYLTYPANHLNH